MQQTETRPYTSAAVMPRVLVFFDYACQFCYLDWPRFKRLRSEHGVELFLVPYELRPALPAEGVPVEQVGGHSANVQEHMRKMAREGSLGLTFPQFVPNTHYALALEEYARDIDPATHQSVHEAIFEAYNVRAENIGDAQVLLRVAANQGLDTRDVQAAWDEGRFDNRLTKFLELAMSVGVSATPSALICNQLFIGSRPYRVLEESLEHCLTAPDRLAVGAQAESRANAAAADDEMVSRPSR